MRFEADADLAADPVRVAATVADLRTYPTWLGIVGAAEPTAPHPDDPGPAWHVTLQARLGPLVRRKGLRMVRTTPEHAADDDSDTDETIVVFERMEHDGRSHGEWILTSRVRAGKGGGSTLAVELRYDGVGWVPGLDLLLREEAKRAGRRLDALLAPG